MKTKPIIPWAILVVLLAARLHKHRFRNWCWFQVVNSRWKTITICAVWSIEVMKYPWTTPVGFYNGGLHYKADFN